MKKEKITIQQERSTYKTHFTIKNTLYYESEVLIITKNQDNKKFTIYFNKDIKITPYKINKINNFLLTHNYISKKIKNYKSFLNNYYLRNYLNYKVLDYTNYLYF